MPFASSVRTHPTAVVDPAAEIADDVVIGPHVVIEGPVRVGAGSVLRAGACLIGPMTIGEKNDVGYGAVLGERPQHLALDGQGADVVIGDGNTFREHVTIHRGSAAGKKTVIGDRNYLMAGSHVGHDSTLGNNCIFANGALVGGHCEIHDGAFISGNSAVHQRCRVGKLAMISGVSATTRDLPPYVIIQGFNLSAGINVVGMRRAGIPTKSITAVRQAYRILYLTDCTMPEALARINDEIDPDPALDEMLNFIRGSKMGVNLRHGRIGGKEAA